MKFIWFIFLMGLSLAGAAESNQAGNQDDSDATVADPQFLANPHLWGQLITGSMATMLAVVAVCIGLWLLSSFPFSGRSVSDVPSHSLIWNTLCGLGPDTYLVIVFILPYIAFKFYTVWFLVGGAIYILVRVSFQIIREREYISQITAESPKWSVAEELAIDSSLKERAEEEKLKVAQEEEQIIEESKERKKRGRIRIELPQKLK